MTNSVLIDGKYNEKRICVSIPKHMFNYFIIEKGGRETAIYELRLEINKGLIENSQDAQEFVLNEIVKPSLYKAISAKGAEHQYDLEDF